MTFLDLFAGIGGFRRGLERSGHSCIGHVEIDKYANKSYMAMYGLEACPHGAEAGSNSYNMCKPEVRKNCDGKTCKGEWYAKDIKQIRAGEIPKAEIWTFGFPCTDVSISGRMEGIHGERSGLFFTVAGLLKSTAPQDKPRYLIVENVKHLVSCERGTAFTTVLFELWEAGYDCEWFVVNSNAHGVPQNRERVYIVGHLRGGRAGKIFPFGRANPAPVKRLIDGKQGKRVYDPSGASITLTASGGGFAGRTGLYAVGINRREGLKGELDGANTLTASDARGLNRNQDQNAVPAKIAPCAAFIDLTAEPKVMDNARCIRARQYSGIGNHWGETSGIFLCHGHPDCAMAALPPGILLCCRIRRLTPRECWRLQAFDDYLFDRARAAGISDAQLYKQAGNAVTVNVVYEIGLRLAGGGA